MGDENVQQVGDVGGGTSNSDERQITFQESVPVEESFANNPSNTGLSWDEFTVDETGQTVRVDEVPQGEPIDATPSQDVEGTTPSGKPMYTEEELIAIAKDEGVRHIDTERIPDHLKPIYREFQRGWQKEFQRLAEQRREAPQPAAEQPPVPRTIEEAYLMDREGTMQFVNQKIREAMDDNFVEAQRLMAVKLDLLEAGRKADERAAAIDRSRTMGAIAVHGAIPDYKTKRAELEEFVYSIMPDDPLTPQELGLLGDPARLGPTAVKLVKFFNRMYDMVNKGNNNQSLASREKKQTPQPLLGVSSGGPNPMRGSGSQPRRASGQSLDVLMKEATRTGDWTKVLEAKGY